MIRRSGQGPEAARARSSPREGIDGGASLAEPVSYDALRGPWRLMWGVPEPASEITLAVFECSDEERKGRDGRRRRRAGEPAVALRQCLGVARVRASTLPGRWRAYLLPLHSSGLVGPGREPPIGQLEVELRFERGGTGSLLAAYAQPRAPLRDWGSPEFRSKPPERAAASRQRQALVAHGLEAAARCAAAGGDLGLSREGAEDVLGTRAQRFSVKRMRAAVERARDSVTAPRGVARALSRFSYDPASWERPLASVALALLGVLAIEYAELALPATLLLIAALGVAVRFFTRHAVAQHLNATRLEDLRLETGRSSRSGSGSFPSSRSQVGAAGMEAPRPAQGGQQGLQVNVRRAPLQVRPLTAPAELAGLAARGILTAGRGLVGAVGLGTRAVGATAAATAGAAGQAAKDTAERLGQKVAKVRRKAAVVVCLTKYRELQRQYRQLLEQASGAQARVNATARRCEQLQSIFLWVDPAGSFCVFLCLALASLAMLQFGIRRVVQVVFLFYLRPPYLRRPVPNILFSAMSRIPPWHESPDLQSMYAARGFFDKAEGGGGVRE